MHLDIRTITIDFELLSLDGHQSENTNDAKTSLLAAAALPVSSGLCVFPAEGLPFRHLPPAACSPKKGPRLADHFECSRCHEHRGRHEFSVFQQLRADRVCSECTTKRRPSSSQLKCSRCQENKGRDDFTGHQQRRANRIAEVDQDKTPSVLHCAVGMFWNTVFVCVTSAAIP